MSYRAQREIFFTFIVICNYNREYRGGRTKLCIDLIMRKLETYKLSPLNWLARFPWFPTQFANFQGIVPSSHFWIRTLTKSNSTIRLYTYNMYVSGNEHSNCPNYFLLGNLSVKTLKIKQSVVILLYWENRFLFANHNKGKNISRWARWPDAWFLISEPLFNLYLQYTVLKYR